MRVKPYQQPNSPYWWIRYTPAKNQPQERKTTKISHHGKKKPPQVVLDICRAIEERLAKAQFGLSPDLVPKAIKEFIPEYLASLKGLSDQTITTRAMHLGCWCKWCAEQQIDTLTQVTKRNAVQYVDHLKTTCTALTVSTRLCTLRLASDEAKSRGYMVIENPFSMRIRGAKAKPRDAWTMAEIGALLTIEDPPWLKTAIRVSLYTGCRSGSINTLLWKDIDFETKVIDFTRSKTGEYPVGMAPKLEEYLVNLWDAVKPKPEDPITPELAGKPSNYLARVFHCRRAKAGVSRGTFHWFRHLMKSALVDSGCPMEVSMKILNHSGESVSRHYLHLQAAKTIEWLSKVKFE